MELADITNCFLTEATSVIFGGTFSFIPEEIAGFLVKGIDTELADITNCFLTEAAGAFSGGTFSFILEGTTGFLAKESTRN
uniref:Uncharacterized protein n=1 Tax=Helianthus annuus TaxID=4232 RepID=A0A251S8Y6_HELAN